MLKQFQTGYDIEATWLLRGYSFGVDTDVLERDTVGLGMIGRCFEACLGQINPNNVSPFSSHRFTKNSPTAPDV